MLDFRQTLISSSLRKVLNRLHYPLEVMLTGVRWYAAYPLSLRHIEEMLKERAINLHDVPQKITIDKSGANTAAIESVKADACVDILMRQRKYLNNVVEQDHRAVKRITGPMLGVKSFWSARLIMMIGRAAAEQMDIRSVLGQLRSLSATREDWAPYRGQLSTDQGTMASMVFRNSSRRVGLR